MAWHVRILCGLLLAPLCACGPDISDNDHTSSGGIEADELEQLSSGVQVGENWKGVIDCDGAHVDVHDVSGWSYYKQLVVTDTAAASYLRSKLEHAAKNDPFISPDSFQLSLPPSAPGELVLRIDTSNDIKRDFSVSTYVANFGAARVDVQKYTWEVEVSPGLFRKHTDLSVRFVRNGWWEYVCTPGLSGDPDSCGPTGNGWNEWEIANWIFSGCRER